MILIGNGRVITRDTTNPYIENGAVCIQGNLIKEVGTWENLREQYKEAEWVDAHGGLIMPGFINTHNHCYSAFARGLSIPGNQPTNFMEILENTWWTIDRKLTLSQTYYSAATTYLDCIKNGVTTVFDHHASFGAIGGSLSKIAEAAKQMGVRTCLAYEISDRDGLAKMKQSVQENIEFIQYARQDDTDMLQAMMGMHASFTLSDETLEYCLSQNTQGAGYHIHVAEDRYDLEQCQSKYHMSIVERLNKKGILGKKTIAGHCIHVNQEDMDILKETDTCVVHNPESNMGNAVGCPDVLTMFKKGILLGLGTDGYTNDMLESMKVANLLQKHNTQNPSAAWSEIPTMLFQHNAMIAERFFSKPVGILKEGAYADVIVMDYNPLTPMNQDNSNGHLLFGLNGRNTVTTIINGVIRMKDRILQGIGEEELLAQSRIEAKKLWEDVSNKDGCKYE